MKTTLTASLVLLLAVTVYLFTGSASYDAASENISASASMLVPVPSDGNTFILGAFNDSRDVNFTYISDILGFNLWHIYIGSEQVGNKTYPIGWTDWASNDKLFNPINEYSTGITNQLGNIGSHNMQALMMRPKLEWLFYGQRSDYQCEEGHIDDNYWFYAFNNHDVGSPYAADFHDNTQYGNNEWVRHCYGNPSNPQIAAGFVVRRLMANAEQCKSVGDFHCDSESDWLIKPRIRIDSTLADNSQNLNMIVCKIVILDQNGDNLLTTHLRVRHFTDEFSNYDGRYLEEFRYESGDTTLTINGAWGSGWNMFTARGDNTSDGSCHADIQVYWYGNCDMWIDYVRVDNDKADELLNPNNPNHERDSLWLEWEARDIACHSGGAASYRFYIEQFEFNNIPCMAYATRKLDSLYNICTGGKHISLVCIPTPMSYSGHVSWNDRLRVQNPEHFINNFVDKVGVREFLLASYPFNSSYHYPETYPYCTWTKIPGTLNVTLQAGILADTVSPAVYDAWLQMYLDSIPYSFESGFTAGFRNSVQEDQGNFRYTMQFGDAVSKETELPFIYNTYAGIWFCQCGAPDTGCAHNMTTGEVQREPTNEEMDMTTNVALTYGARGLIYFWYPSDPGNIGQSFYDRGIVENNGQPRYNNVYGQPKWDTLIRIHQRLKKWEPYIMSFNNDDRHSYIYRIETERGTLLTNSYFRDVVSYIRGTGVPPCTNDAPDTSSGASAPESLRYECNEDRYLQAATFKKSTDDGNKYFMIVNRRCSPLQTSTHNDGERYVRVFFDQNSSHLPGYRNWNIIDVENPRAIVGTFDKTAYNPYVNLGWFDPGKGRLYMIKPVMKSGGTLAGNEDVSGVEFTCEDTVFNDGHNITIDSGTTISFTDSATIIMTGGTFTAGSPTAPSGQLNTFKGLGSGKWKGLRFNGSTVKIYNSKFQDISSQTGGSYAVSSIDCPLNDIRGNTFISSTDTAGGVNILYVDISSTSAYVMYNTFTMNSSFARAVQVQGFAGLTAGVYVKANTMTSGGNATGIFLSTITGGVVKNNSITGFSTGVNTVLSGVNLYGNTISNTSALSKGILGTGSSNLSLVPSGGTWIGGFNSITNTSGNSKNIDISSSIFFLDGGKNTFDVTSSSSAYHLYGSFYDDGGDHSEQENNCFKLGGTQLDAPDSPNNDVTDGSNPITFDFLDYTCGATPPTGITVVDIGNGLYDTIPTSSGGAGGGFSNRKSLHLDKGEYSRAPGREGVVTITSRALYDSIRVQLLHRHYSVVKALCYELIDDYPNSTEAVASLQTLFMASLKTDTSSGSVSALKTYYENLILNNGSNIALVKISNYLVQKCKVLLRQYTSALSGFQQIINGNQYNYEGLLARWDYMATSLLMQGQGGGESSIKNYELGITNFESEEFEKFDKLWWGDDDKSPLTKQQRQEITKTIISVFEVTKTREEVKSKILEVKSESGDIDAEKELKVMKTLRDIVKSERPKDVFEHMRIVNNDIQKIFGSTMDNSKPDGNNNIPSVFRLSQNYPNPFNPVTKINFDLPKNAKVTLIIYDILGREVKRLVNNEIKSAGRYVVDFNGINFASGVYFCRIEAEEPNGNKFTDAKKMVLVK